MMASALGDIFAGWCGGWWLHDPALREAGAFVAYLGLLAFGELGK